MARAAKARREDRADVDELGASVVARLTDVPWELFDSKDLASSGETRYMVSRIQEDLLKVAAVDPARAGRIWDHNVPGFVPRPAELPDVEMIPAPGNSIEPGRRRRRNASEPFFEPSQSLGATGERGDKIRAAPESSAGVTDAGSRKKRHSKDRDDVDPNAERIQLLLDGLNKQYLKTEDRYHFRDKTGDVAFEAQGKKLLTQHETPAVVASMVDLAEARGWSSLKLTGTQEFKREAWLQANARGLETTGYKPNDLDRARLEELQKERTANSPSNTIADNRQRARQREDWKARFDPVADEGRGEPCIPLTQGQDQFLRAMEATMRHRGDAAEAIAKARDIAVEKLTSDRVHVGTIVEVGTAPYQDKKGEKDSHFVTLEDDKGQRSKVWGVDLPRALEASGAEPGQKVAVVYRGQKPVEVDVKVRNNEGEVLGTKRTTVERNTWEVVQFDRLREEAKASVRQAIERQNNLAALKVFDRSAKPQAPSNGPVTSGRRERNRERSV